MAALAEAAQVVAAVVAEAESATEELDLHQVLLAVMYLQVLEATREKGIRKAHPPTISSQSRNGRFEDKEQDLETVREKKKKEVKWSKIKRLVAKQRLNLRSQ
jgi:hypothetical protein